MSFLKKSEEHLALVKETSRTAWVRFVNGLKLDGSQRYAVVQLLAAYQERVARLEQEVWNTKNTLDRVLNERDRFYVRLDDV